MKRRKLKTETIKKIILVSVMIFLMPVAAAYGMQQEEQRTVHVAANGSDESGNGTQSSP